MWISKCWSEKGHIQKKINVKKRQPSLWYSEPSDFIKSKQNLSISYLPKSCLSFSVRLDILDCILDSLELDSSYSFRIRAPSTKNNNMRWGTHAYLWYIFAWLSQGGKNFTWYIHLSLEKFKCLYNLSESLPNLVQPRWGSWYSQIWN